MRPARLRRPGITPATLLAAILLAATFLTAAFLTADAPQPAPTRPIPGPPANAPQAIVSLGDSTVSGEGAGDYEPATTGQHGDWCHRSALAEIHRTTLPGVTKTINLACSGANTATVGLGTAVHYTEPSQAAQLAAVATRDRVRAVVVAVGANDDPQFATALDDCVQAWADDGSCSAALRTGWHHRVDLMVPKVTRVLRDIHTVMTHAGYPPGSYQLVLQSYAAPIGPDASTDLLGLAGCPFRPADLNWVRTTAVTVLDAGLHDAANAGDARYLDLADAGIGHEACSGGNHPANEWFTRLTVAWQDLKDAARVGHILQESFHPNALGQAAFGGCLGEFLTTTDRAAACIAGRDGILHPAALTGHS